MYGEIGVHPAWGVEGEPRVDRALRMATKLHQGQIDKGGYPYVLHPIRVMTQVTAWGFDADAVVSAVLHDSVEDTSYSLIQAEADWGPVVVDMLDHVTHIKGQPYEEFIYRIIASGDPGIMAIKLADIQDNLQGWRVRSLPEAVQCRLHDKYLPARAKLIEALRGRI